MRIVAELRDTEHGAIDGGTHCDDSTPVSEELCPAHNMATANAVRDAGPRRSASRSAPCSMDTTCGAHDRSEGAPQVSCHAHTSGEDGPAADAGGSGTLSG